MSFYNRQYQDAPINQSLNDLTTRKNRFLSSTGFSNNPNTRLPQLSRSSSSSKSTKLKLTTI